MYRDPYCGCEIEYPSGLRLLCDHCKIDGPLPGSYADPDHERNRNDLKALREAARRLADDDEPEALGVVKLRIDELEEEEWQRTGRISCDDCGTLVKTDTLESLPEHGCLARQRTRTP